MADNSKLKTHNWVLLAEDLCRECGDGGVRVSPAAGLEPGLAAGVVEEGLPIPAVLDRDLRQEKAAGGAPLDEDAVATDSHLRRRGSAKRREDGDLDPHVLELAGCEGWESGVFERSGDGVVPHRSPQRRHADHMTDAAAEHTVDFQCDERTPGLEQKRRIGCGGGEGTFREAGIDGGSRELEQKAPVVGGNLLR